MKADLGNVVFIVWRESVEALLIVGILNTWIRSRDASETRRAGMFLWCGVGAGLLLAIALAAGLSYFSGFSSEATQQMFQTVMEIIAAVLIIQMVVWMKRHGRTLKRDMESHLSAAAADRNWWGLFVLALVAVAREGSEAVVFLYGTLSVSANESLPLRLSAVLGGLAAAVGTYLLLQAGSRYLSWRVFFRVTELMLLCLAGALLVTAVDNLVALDYLPELSGRLWDTSAMLSDGGRIGALIAALTGYRARPDLTEVVALAMYWGAMWGLLFRPRSVPRAT